MSSESPFNDENTTLVYVMGASSSGKTFMVNQQVLDDVKSNYTIDGGHLRDISDWYKIQKRLYFLEAYDAMKYSNDMKKNIYKDHVLKSQDEFDREKEKWSLKGLFSFGNQEEVKNKMTQLETKLRENIPPESYATYIEKKKSL